jgi:hypothetical protein
MGKYLHQFLELLLQAREMVAIHNPGYRTIENLSDRDGSSPIGSLLEDQGCVNRY